MHTNVGNDNEHTTEYGKANNIVPQCQVVEAEGTQNTSTRHLNVETVTVVFEPELGHFIDNQSFVCIVEYRQLYEVSRGVQCNKWIGRAHHLQPLRHCLRSIVIQIQK